MAALYDRVGMTTATTGTGTLTLGSAITDATNGDYLTFADVGVPNATVVNYLIVNGNNFELGTGTYTSSGTTLTRGATLSKTGGTKGTTAISLVGSSNVYIVPQAAATWNFPAAQTIGTLSGDLTLSPSTGVVNAPTYYTTAGGGFQLNPVGSRNWLVTNFSSLALQTMGSNFRIAWESSTGVNTASMDVGLSRNAAGVLEVNTGTTGTFATLKIGGLRVGYVAKTAAYTAVIADEVISCDATGGAFSVTLPTAVGCTGQIYTIKKIDSSANAVTVATTSSQTIDGASTYSLSAQWNTLTVVSNNANWLIQSKV